MEDKVSSSPPISLNAHSSLSQQIPKDFFGRPIVQKKGSTKPVNSRKTQMKRAPVIYKFNEGSSSAVRKPVKVSVFL